MAFPSKYEGKCSICQEPINEGDMIERDSDDNGWRHEGCDDE